MGSNSVTFSLQFDEMYRELEDQKELAMTRLTELEKLNVDYQAAVQECEKLRLDVSTVEINRLDGVAVSGEIKDTSYTWNKNGQPVDVFPNNFVNRPSFKNLYDPFWPVIHRCQKSSDIWKVTSGGWAEIENVEKMQTFGFSISALPPDGTF